VTGGGGGGGGGGGVAAGDRGAARAGFLTAMRLTEPGPADAESGPLRAVELPTPRLAPNEVLIDVVACAVCRTDLQLASGDLPAHKLPVTPGHQTVGAIVAVGSDVDEHRLGSLVGVTWFGGSCGRCSWCLAGRQNLCRQAEFTGWDRDGGYATTIVARADCAFELPSDYLADRPVLERAIAMSPLLCGGVIGFRSLRIAEVGPASAGLRLGLYGYGASATLVLQVARFWGCEVSVITRSEAEVERALTAGASWAGTYQQKPPMLDAAITFAPVGDVVVSALQSLDRGGIVAVNAIHLDRVPQFNYDDLWWERSLRSVANVTPADVRDFLELVPRAGVATIHEELPLSQANAALARLDAGDVRGSLVLVP
jgi:propanol-preferring alcohol dehydrogenase